jgi:Domain of Unknown Function (DUF1080)
MRNLLRTALAGVLIAAGAGAQADNQLTAAEKAAGWQLLFDGKTFNGWVDPAKQSPPGDSFVIEDGCLKSVAHAKIEEDLFSRDTFRDFELDFDWKISPRGNSGLKYRIQDHLFLSGEQTRNFPQLVNDSMKNRRTDRPAKGQDYVIGFEYQITDNTANPDAIANGPMHRTAALYDVLAASKDVTRPVGEFNHSRLVVKGDHVEHWLNGEKVLDTSLKSPAVAQSMAKRWGETSPVYQFLVNQPKADCPISLQNHGDVAWFKNLKILRL